MPVLLDRKAASDALRSQPWVRTATGLLPKTTNEKQAENVAVLECLHCDAYLPRSCLSLAADAFTI